MKRQVPLILTFVVGVAMILAAFVPHPPFDRLDQDLTDVFNILAAFAFVLGAGNLVQIHLNSASKRRKGWGFSVVTLVGFFFTLIVGLFKIGNPDGLSGKLDAAGSLYTAVYDYSLAPLSSTMFSLLAFYVASASYRAFRAKNREATMLLIAAFFILLGRTPAGAYITNLMPGIVELVFGAIFAYLAWSSWRSKRLLATSVLAVIAAFMIVRTIWVQAGTLSGSQVVVFLGFYVVAIALGVIAWRAWGRRQPWMSIAFWTLCAAAVLVGLMLHQSDLNAEGAGYIRIPALVNWIMISPQMAGQRAIMIGICLGVISMSLRLILGVERSHLGSDSD